jgi:hypothetical protein
MNKNALKLKSQSICTWHPEKKELKFSLEHISGILNCDIQKGPGKSHHFSNVTHKPTGMKISLVSGAYTVVFSTSCNGVENVAARAPATSKPHAC